MSNEVKQTLDEFIDDLKKLMGNRLKKIILYGSYARGDYTEDSDIDIMILTDCDLKERENYFEKIVEIAFDIELEKEIYISPIIKNINDYNERIEFIPYYMNIEKEGIELK